MLFYWHAAAMLKARDASGLRAMPLGWQLAVIIVAKVLVLTALWYVFVKDHKVQGDAEATARYLLTPAAVPQKQTVPRSPWE